MSEHLVTIKAKTKVEFNQIEKKLQSLAKNVYSQISTAEWIPVVNKLCLSIKRPGETVVLPKNPVKMISSHDALMVLIYYEEDIQLEVHKDKEDQALDFFFV